MKKIISSLCAFSLACSLFGMPAMAFAASEEGASAQPRISQTEEPVDPLAEDAAGPVKKEEPAQDAVGSDDAKAPVYNDEAESAAAPAPSAPAEEQPTLWDSIIGFFTGANASDEDGASDVEVQIDKSREVTGSSLTVTFYTSLPQALAASSTPLSLSVDGKTAEFQTSGGAGTVLTASITGISAGSKAVTVSGSHHLSLTHRIDFKNGTKHAFNVIDAILEANGPQAEGAGFMPYGDFDGSGELDDEDSRQISEAYVQESDDLRFDLSDDGSVTLKDVQLFAASKGRQAAGPSVVTETPDGTQTDPDVPEGTTVLLDGEAVTGDAAAAALAGLFTNSGHVVGLTASANVVPGAEKAPVSAGTPVELTLNANGALMDTITLHSPVQGGTGVSVPLEGVVTIKFEKDGQNGEATIPIPCASISEASGADLLSEVSVQVNQAAGTVRINLGENVKVYDMGFTFTKASADDTLVQLSKVDYTAASTTDPDPDVPDVPDPDEPAPLPTTPEAFVISKADDKLIEATWDKAQNAVGYEVELVTGMEASDILTTTNTSIQIRTFAGAPLENGTLYSLRVRAVNAEDAKSEWTAWEDATPELKTPPANPGAPTLTPGYKEITAVWNAVDRAEGYMLYYAKSGSSDFTAIETTETERTVRGLEVDTSYTFYVVATNRFGSSDATGTPPRATARTTYVTTKVPWFSLINRTVQDKDMYLPTDVFKSATAGGDAEVGANLVDGDYNTTYEIPAGHYPTWDDAAKVVFNETHNLREIAISTNLGKGYADDIEDVWVRTISGRGVTTTTFSKNSGDNSLTWAPAPTRDGSTEVATNTIMVRLPKIVSNASQVEVIIRRAGDATMTISELAFYEATTLPESIDSLFKPGSLKTELADGVNEEMILDLRDLVNVEDPVTKMGPNATAERYWATDELMEELEAAYALLQSQSARTVVTHPEIYGSSSNVRGTNAWQPTGSVAYGGAKVQVYVTPVSGMDGVTPGEGTKLKLIAAQNHGTDGSLMQSLGYLKVGVNTITMPEIGSAGVERGGGLYVEYEERGCPAYEVKVVGAQEIPMLDVFGVTDNAQVKLLARAYAAELRAYADQLVSKHMDGAHKEGYNARLCVANATEILTNQALISVPASVMVQSFDEAKADGAEDGAAALAVGLPFTDKMITLLYQQAGLFDVSDGANAGAVATYGANNAAGSTHVGFRYMAAGSAGMQVTANHVGLDWAEAIGLGTVPTLAVTLDGRYKLGDPYDWDFSRLVASAFTADNQTFPMVLTDYYAQMVTSKDKNEQAGQPAQRFSYDDVRAYLDSGAGAKLDAMPNNLGLAVLWQLHLAYDEGYSYTVFDGADALMDGSIFARMNAYVRNPEKAPAGLVLDGVDADNAFMRLACAASGYDLMPFFDAWGLSATEQTRAYAQTFPTESRELQYMDDDSRKGATNEAQADVPQVAATVQASEPNEAGEVVVSGIALKESASAGANLGFEVLRQVGTDEETRQVVGFVPAGQTTFTDRLTSDNGQMLKYYVRAVDTALYRSDVTEAGEVQADFPRNLNKAYWTVSSTMTGGDDPAAIVDGSIATVYTGERDRMAAGTVGGVAADPNAYASVTIAFGKPTDACGIRYFPGAGAENTFKRLWVQVSDDGVNWTSVGYKEIDPSTFTASKCATVYFTKSMVMPSTEIGEGSQITVQNASYLRVSDLDTSAETPISIAEIDVIGSLPDAVSFQTDEDGDVMGIGRVEEDVRVQAAADGIHDGAETVIPAGSLVLSGSYTGNPAKSTIVLRDALGNEVSHAAKQVILAERDPMNDISYSASGTWVVYFEPGTWEEDAAGWSFVSASLYRSAACGDREGAVMTASCPSARIPIDASGEVACAAFDFGTGM